MKEQDAAHSFEKWTYENDIHGTAYAFYKNNDFEFKAVITNPESLVSQLNELTCLRSELQQKDEVIKDLLSIARSAPIDHINFGKTKHEAIIDRAKESIKSKS